MRQRLIIPQSIHDPTASQLRSLNRTHLVRPSWCGLWPSRRAHLVGREARDANIVLPLEHHLNVTRFESGAATELAEFAGCGDEIVDKIIGNLEEDLGELDMD